VFADFFIKRPVFATVCALLIILAGAVSIPTLPISLYPQLAPPQVLVTSNYVGANAQVVESAVTIPLEEQINGVEGMRYIASTSSNDGTSAITTTFKTDYDLNIAAVDVQNRVAAAQGRLPQEVTSTGVTISKANSNFVFAAAFYSPDGRYSDSFISNYLDVYVKDALKRITGVGDVVIFGERKYAMRIWLDPQKLAARSLAATDVVAALQEQNVEVPAGQIGQPPSDPAQVYQIPVRVIGRLSDPQQFDRLIIKNTPNGVILLQDVGRAELGAESYATDLKFSGRTAIGVGVQQLSNANALQVDRDAKAELERLSASFPPGLHYEIPFDTTGVVGDSIREVVKTLFEAIIIVIIVIFFFLLDWRATIIPAITIPVSLVGTFAFIKIFGFSINSLTMFGITLATGLVVDDAIVVIENVQRHLAEDNTSPAVATSVAMSEVTSAVIATSLVLISVFVPVSFFPGTTGILYKQFSLTIAFAIAISAFNALTLSPALSALLLKREESKHGLFLAIENGLHRLGKWYGRIVHHAIGLRWVLLLLFAAGLVATGYFYTHVPTAFVPGEDQNYLIAIVQTPPGASLTYTSMVAEKATKIILADDDVYGTFAVMGFSLSGGSSSNYGLIFVPLKSVDQRIKKGDGHSASEIYQKLSPQLFGVPGGLVIMFEPPPIQGIGSFGGFQFELQDSGRNTLQDIDRVAHQMIGASRQGKELTGLYTSYTSNDPQLLVSIDREKAKAIGVPISQVGGALSVYMGSVYVNDFNFNNRSYRVFVQADEPYRMTAKDLRQLYARSDSGQMVPLENLVTIAEASGPQVISHYNLFRSAEIDGQGVPGVSSGQALQAMEKLAKQNMIQGMTFSWTGLSLEEIESAGKAIVIFGLGLLVVYLTLSAQYESFALPFIILLAVPMAVLGALLALVVRGMPNDIYCQIGLVLLIGLSAKNAILIVEFAEQLRGHGRSIVDAAIEAGELRLRPILMTSFAFILGIAPLTVATGAGALGRRSVGTTIVGGMLFSTILNLFFIPVLYVIFKTLLEKISPRKEPPTSPATEPPTAPGEVVA